jgi:hypothetical protein
VAEKSSDLDVSDGLIDLDVSDGLIDLDVSDGLIDLDVSDGLIDLSRELFSPHTFRLSDRQTKRSEREWWSYGFE